jgi:hypothetical protein
MNCGIRVAAGVGVGYFMGRTRKMKLALMIAVASAMGKLGARPVEMLQQRTKQLSTTPEISKIVESVRGELFSAAKTAAAEVATKRIDSLSDRLKGGIATVPPEEPRGEDRGSETDEAEGAVPAHAGNSRSENGAAGPSAGPPPVRRTR